MSVFTKPNRTRSNVVEAVLLVVDDRTESPGPLTYGGYRVDAPGFDPDVFGRAIAKALDAGIRVVPADRPGVFRVANPANGAVYTVSRRRCDCRAGQFGGTCKHRALLCLLTSICPGMTRPRAP